MTSEDFENPFLSRLSDLLVFHRFRISSQGGPAILLDYRRFMTERIRVRHHTAQVASLPHSSAIQGRMLHPT